MELFFGVDDPVQRSLSLVGEDLVFCFRASVWFDRV